MDVTCQSGEVGDSWYVLLVVEDSLGELFVGGVLGQFREAEGGTYGASTAMGCRYLPDEEAQILAGFDTNTEQQQTLRDLATKGLMTLAYEGPTEEQLSRAIENAKKNLPEQRITNSYWMSTLTENTERGVDYDAEYEAAVNNISAEGIKSVLQEIISQGNFKETVMFPQE